LGPAVHAAAQEGDLVPETLEGHGLDLTGLEMQIHLARERVGRVSGSKRMRWVRPTKVSAPGSAVSEVVEHVITPDPEVRKLHPLARVGGAAIPRYIPGPPTPSAGAPVVVTGPEIVSRV